MKYFEVLFLKFKFKIKNMKIKGILECIFSFLNAIVTQM